jgi:putative ABC transport system permease protein
VGRLLLLWRLVGGDIKRRRTQFGAVGGDDRDDDHNVDVGLALHGVSDNPFARTRAATKGPDASAMYGVRGFAHPPGAFPGSLRRFEALRRAPGVTGSSGPYPFAWSRLTARGLSVQVLAEGRDRAAAATDEPLLTAGGWVRPGGAVLDRAFADALGIHVGDRIGLNGRAYRVVGIALTTADSFYPEGDGRVWLTRADVQRVEAGGRPAGYLLNLKLAHPATAPAFAAEHAAPLASRQAWQAWSL